jgi:hypothetical protein
VAVGRRLGDRRGADLVIGAAAILDDDLLSPRFGEALRERAGRLSLTPPGAAGTRMVIGLVG